MTCLPGVRSSPVNIGALELAISESQVLPSQILILSSTYPSSAGSGGKGCGKNNYQNSTDCINIKNKITITLKW